MSKHKTIMEAIEADNYEAMDKFVDLLKDFYAGDDNEKAYKVEAEVNKELVRMFNILDVKFDK